MEPVVGIDLGTTNSVVATVEDGVLVVIAGRSGHKLMPSIVALSKDNKRLVGHVAKRQAMVNPTRTIYAAKRLIGRKWSSTQSADVCKRLAYPTVAGPNDDIRVQFGDEALSMAEVSAMILTEMRLDAEAYFGQPVTKAVITVPAYFNDNQRQSTRDAGRIAGWDVLRIINEPTAAALAYGFGRQIDKRVLVFDLGGGTFDVSVLDISNGVFDVIATGGDTFLGGEDFDERIIQALTSSFLADEGVDLRQNAMALQRLRDAAEKAKIELSATQSTDVSLPFIFTGPKGGMHLQRTITRQDFETFTHDLVNKCVDICKQVVQDAGLRPGQIDDVLLVGGMSRMPLVQQEVKRFLGREPSRTVHPDEVVALGAAIQSQALARDAGEMLLLDVTPHSLGISITSGLFQVLLPRNTTVPASARHVFTTGKDYQTTAKIMVFQGEDAVAGKNELLGEFILSGLKSATRGEVEIEVLFDISADGIVSVSARDVESGQLQSITVSAASGLTENEVQQIMEDNEDYLLAQRADVQYDDVKREVEALSRDLAKLLGKAGVKMGEGKTGAEAVQTARRLTERVQDAVAARDAAALFALKEGLQQSVQLFRGVVDRTG